MPARVSNALQATLRRAHDAMQEADARGMSPEAFADAVRAAEEISAFMDGERVTFHDGPLPPLPPEHAFADTFTESEVPEPVAVTQIPLIEEDAVVPPTFRRVRIENIIPPNPPGNPTTAFVQNVRQLGILQPIIVRELQPVAGVAHAYEVVAGTRRLAAAQACDMRTIPALVYEVATTTRTVSAAALSENLQRASNIARDVDMISRLIGGGESIDRIRERLHLSRGQMFNRVALLSLNAEWRIVFRERRMALCTATRIAGLSRHAQSGLTEAAAQITGRITSAWVNSQLGEVPNRTAVSEEIFEAAPSQIGLGNYSREWAARVMAQGMISVLAHYVVQDVIDRAVTAGTAALSAYNGAAVPSDYMTSIIANGTRDALNGPDDPPQAFERIGTGRVPVNNPQPVDDTDDATLAVSAGVQPSNTTFVMTEGWGSVISLLEQVEQVIPADGEEITDDFATRLNRLLTDANEGRRTSAPVVTSAGAASAIAMQDARRSVRRGSVSST